MLTRLHVIKNSVGRECVKLATLGYRYVQVSPVQEHIQASAWWTDYQPVSYLLQSKRGTRGDLSSMIKACNNARVSVIVDVVLNHSE
ncbi:glycoside hydrolase family 13 protein [Gonapodya prolifera JEL478]|uniref:Glycoside hydrolase family 13 protein n=1 Tax=Gonapodya prolifera (strain JEL478) TaxID=1344416 RepID=A0A139ADA8_GONPJ|nr:glycoside hydrolase family 13 protein [Gonapodya prolifera JEL478]|eukprot:KXS14738.1 glycoside hydrolase family 13 protein [Gonapodya prolifera JEL478]